MEALAGMDRDALGMALSVLIDDYAAWIEDQGSRVGNEVTGHDEQANAALARCSDIQKRLIEGLQLLTDPKGDAALRAFRFANRAMAMQRVHSLYALARRRGETVELAEFDAPKNRTWRPFQPDFILLSIPSLADPKHKDRSQPMEAFAVPGSSGGQRPIMPDYVRLTGPPDRAPAAGGG